MIGDHVPLIGTEDRYLDYIAKVVDADPPLTAEQRARLQLLLSPVAVDLRTRLDNRTAIVAVV
jgi:hypothetical protein